MLLGGLVLIGVGYYDFYQLVQKRRRMEMTAVKSTSNPHVENPEDNKNIISMDRSLATIN